MSRWTIRLPLVAGGPGWRGRLRSAFRGLNDPLVGRLTEKSFELWTVGCLLPQEGLQVAFVQTQGEPADGDCAEELLGSDLGCRHGDDGLPQLFDLLGRGGSRYGHVTDFNTSMTSTT